MTDKEMIAVVESMEQHGGADLFEYLKAFRIAEAVLDEGMGSPIRINRSNRERNAILMAICLAAHVRAEQYARSGSE